MPRLLAVSGPEWFTNCHSKSRLLVVDDRLKSKMNRKGVNWGGATMQLLTWKAESDADEVFLDLCPA